MRGILLVAASVLAAILTGCGSTGSAAPRNATMILDFTPNAVHTGIYAAIAEHYDRDAGLRLHVTAPTASSDPIKLLETGRVDFAILDIHDLAIARARGQDLVGIMAIVERPLSAVIAAPAIGSPKALQGKTVGVTGVPSDTAVLRSVVAGAGGEPDRIKTITIGFNAVADLLAGRVAGATAFWNDEGVTIQRTRPGYHVFRVDDYGAPAYPELVLCATRQTLRRDPQLAQLAVKALTRGYEFTEAHPSRAAQDLERQATGLDSKLVAAQLTALLPAFQAPDGRVGELDVSTLRAWAGWEARFGIVRRRPDVSASFEESLTSAPAHP